MALTTLNPNTLIKSADLNANFNQCVLKETLTTKGDIFAASGASTVVRHSVGSNGKMLVADSTQTTGLNWSTPFTNPLTTKGDLLGFDTASNRIPIGTNGKVLTADSTLTLGLGWKTPTSPFARLYKTTNQTGVNPNNSAVKIALDSVTYDSASGLQAGSNSYISQLSGYYKVCLSINVSSVNTLANTYYAQIYKNGSLYSSGPYTTFSAGAAVGCYISDIVVLNATDYVQAYLFGAGNNSASTLTINCGGGLTFMTVEYIGTTLV